MLVEINVDNRYRVRITEKCHRSCEDDGHQLKRPMNRFNINSNKV